MKRKVMAVVLAAGLTSGCASIVSDSNYLVAVDSSPSNARFVVKDKSGRRVESGTTPATLNLEAGAGYFKGQSYTVEMAKKGYENSTTTLNSGVDGWYWANILFGGLPGMLFVDPATGAMYDLPERVEGRLNELSGSQSRRSVDGSSTRVKTEAKLFGLNYARIEQLAYRQGCDEVKTLSIAKPVELYEVICPDSGKKMFKCEWNDCEVIN